MKCPKFIDLFCGIGGMRLAFESAGAQCVFSSDWDKYAQITYEANFGEKPHGDLRAIASEDLPPHDILVAGFPCQPFSISGVSKKNSRRVLAGGWSAPTTGNRSQVLIPQYFACKLPGINTLHGSAQGIQNR